MSILWEEYLFIHTFDRTLKKYPEWRDRDLTNAKFEDRGRFSNHATDTDQGNESDLNVDEDDLEQCEENEGKTITSRNGVELGYVHKILWKW